MDAEVPAEGGVAHAAPGEDARGVDRAGGDDDLRGVDREAADDGVARAVEQDGVHPDHAAVLDADAFGAATGVEAGAGGAGAGGGGGGEERRLRAPRSAGRAP